MADTTVPSKRSEGEGREHFKSVTISATAPEGKELRSETMLYLAFRIQTAVKNQFSVCLLPLMIHYIHSWIWDISNMKALLESQMKEAKWLLLFLLQLFACQQVSCALIYEDMNEPKCKQTVIKMFIQML